jgi:hypothetical protein
LRAYKQRCATEQAKQEHTDDTDFTDFHGFFSFFRAHGFSRIFIKLYSDNIKIIKILFICGHLLNLRHLRAKIVFRQYIFVIRNSKKMSFSSFNLKPTGWALNDPACGF